MDPIWVLALVWASNLNFEQLVSKQVSRPRATFVGDGFETGFIFFFINFLPLNVLNLLFKSKIKYVNENKNKTKTKGNPRRWIPVLCATLAENGRWVSAPRHHREVEEARGLPCPSPLGSPIHLQPAPRIRQPLPPMSSLLRVGRWKIEEAPPLSAPSPLGVGAGGGGLARIMVGSTGSPMILDPRLPGDATSKIGDVVGARCITLIRWCAICVIHIPRLTVGATLESRRHKSSPLGVT